MVIDFKELREQLDDTRIKEILAQFDVHPVKENESEIIFPTCCHNLEGGSPKLYYYKNSRFFHCYTDCATNFDIFSLLRKMYKLRGEDKRLTEIITQCGLNLGFSDTQVDPEKLLIMAQMRYLQELNNSYFPDISKDLKDLPKYDKNIMRQFSFDLVGLSPWIDEGISIEALRHFGIKYDRVHNAIVIPNYDINGDLVGVRERFFNQKDVAKGKYRPAFINGEFCKFSSNETLYGIWQNKTAIKENHAAIIFEGEKSVLKLFDIYGERQSIGLATLGQNISQTHIQYLLKLGVRRVIVAYDADYHNDEEMKPKEKFYTERAAVLAPYFNTSILMDYKHILGYKDSPIDDGKDKFEELLKERKIIV